MSEARSSGRLRKKPRISYAPPDDEEDLETIDEEGASSADSSDKTNVEIDDEFNPRNCKRKHKPKRKRAFFRWADLPPEVRNLIYDISLKRADPITFWATNKTNKRIVRVLDDLDYPLIPQLLLANKATYNEGAPILYKNELAFMTPLAMCTFFSTLSPTTKAWVETVIFKANPRASNYFARPWADDSGLLFPAFNSLVGTTSLKRVWIEVNQVNFGKLPVVAKRIFHNAHSWFEQVGRDGGDRAAGVRLVSVTPKLMADSHGWVKERESFGEEELHNRLVDWINRAG